MQPKPPQTGQTVTTALRDGVRTRTSQRPARAREGVVTSPYEVTPERRLWGDSVTGPLLTAREVAELFSVSAETILRWTRRGELPAFRLPGGAIRFRADELYEWFTARSA